MVGKKPLTPAQMAQQNNRDQTGQYQEKARDLPDMTNLDTPMSTMPPAQQLVTKLFSLADESITSISVDLYGGEVSAEWDAGFGRFQATLNEDDTWTVESRVDLDQYEPESDQTMGQVTATFNTWMKNCDKREFGSRS